ncbi:MAG: prkC 25 [Gemmataceae bacterium]|nr:prkC 25 [Gemmataceae bacterium]
MPGPEDALRIGDSDRPDQPGDRPGELRAVGGYRLLRQVGEGGMSTVYLSYDVPGRRAVAVKLLADHLAGQREFVNRFYREARLSHILHHSNIVQGHAVGYDQETNKHYIVLEFVDGPSAHTALTRLGRVPVGIGVRIGIDIARALQFLHTRNYVHRDVKPDNILLHPSGVAKLADLGLTKRLTDDSHLTSVNQGVGTSYYMPYEQALNAALVDGRSDIFALGATLYHLLTGQVPFRGATHEEILREKEHDAFVPIRHLNPDVPDELADIIAKALSRDPRARYQQAADLAESLEATRLATRIPPFAIGDAPDTQPPLNPSGPEAPTRADLPLREAGQGTDPSGRIGFMASPTPLPTGLRENRFVAGEDQPASAPRVVPAIVTGTLLLVGLLGFMSRSGPSSASAPAGHRDTVVRDQPDSPPGGLSPGARQ